MHDHDIKPTLKRVCVHSAYAETANHGLRAQPPTNRAVPTRSVGMMLP